MPNKTTIHLLRTVLTTPLSLAAALATVLAVSAQEPAPSKPGEHPAATGGAPGFLQEAAQINMATSQFARLGIERSKHPELKRLNELLERDHQHAQTRLEAIAAKQHIALPTSLDAKCQEELSKLRTLTGEEFDREFVKGALQGHARAVAAFQRAALQPNEPAASQYANDLLPSLKQHQEKIRLVAKSIGLDAATIAALETWRPEGVGTPGPGTQAERGSSSPNVDPSEPKLPRPQP